MDVFEGNREDDGGRVWQTVVQPASEVRTAAKEQRDHAKAMAEQAARNERMKRVYDWLRSQPDGATKTAIRGATGINAPRVTEAIETLLKGGNIEPCKLRVGNGQECDGYRAIVEAESDSEIQGDLFG